MIKIRMKINEIKNRKTTEKINEMKAYNRKDQQNWQTLSYTDQK